MRYLYGFLIAIAIHLAALVAVGNYLSKAPIEEKALISFDLGVMSFTKPNGGTPSPSAPSKTKNNTSTSQKSSPTPTQIAPSTVGENSSGSENPTAPTSTSSNLGQAGGANSGDGAFNSAIVNFQNPTYPRLAIKRGLEGTLRLKINISKDGNVTSVDLLSSSGQTILDEAAISSAKGWKFRPHPNGANYFVTKTIVYALK